MGYGFRFTVLRPLTVSHDGSPIPVSASKQRVLLASLLLNANHVVPLDLLVTQIWGEDQPRDARATVRNYVMRLRKTLDSTGGSCTIVSRQPGYLISVPDDAIDLMRFRSLVEQARSAAIEDRATLLRDALALWQEHPLPNVPSEALHREFGPGLVEQRLAAIELHIETNLALGRFPDILDELRELTTAHPLRERFWAQRLTALVQVGRQGEALALFEDLRRKLAEELGIDPGPELQDLHRRLLNSSPSPAPKQLLAAPPSFTGRARELALLDTTGSTVVISAIGGTGGIGKTSLALHWAHRNTDRFPDGQLFANLRGFDPSSSPVSPDAVVRGFLRALGVERSSIPVTAPEQAAMYRDLVANKRMLILLDNARDARQVMPLLPRSRTCTVVITSRNQLTELTSAQGALAVTLDALAESEARDLVVNRVGSERVSREPAAAADLLAQCAGLPLALGIVAARATSYPQLPLAALAEELRDASTRLDSLDAGDLTTSPRAVFSCSYQALDHDTAELFALLSQSPGHDVSLAAAASLTAKPSSLVQSLLRELEVANLLTQHAPNRYRMHDLVRLYASEVCTSTISADDRTAALRRIVDFYLHTAHAAEWLLFPHRPNIELEPPSNGCAPLVIDDEAAALAWFEVEHAGLLAAQRVSSEQGWNTCAWQLAWSLRTFHLNLGRLHDDLDVWRTGLAAAEQLDDPTIEALVHRWLGSAYMRLGRHDESFEHLTRALTLSERAGNALAQAHTHQALAATLARQGDHERGLDHSVRALDIHRDLDDVPGEARALSSVGWCHALLGNHEAAQAHCALALSLNRRLQDRKGEANALDSLGFVALNSGEPEAALGYYQQAVALRRDLRDTSTEANTLQKLGEVHLALRQYTEAREVWQAAVDIYRAQDRIADAERVEHDLNTNPALAQE